MKNNIKFAIVALVLLSAMAVTPNATAAGEYYVVYAMPYDLTGEHSYWHSGSYATAHWLVAVEAGLLSRSLEVDRAYDMELAESMSLSADGMTFTFELKEGLKFSDGGDLDANDVKFTYTSLLSPAINQRSYSTVATYFDNSSIVVVDDLTLTFTLKIPYAFAEGLFAYGIQPEAFFADRMDEEDYTWNTDDMSDAIGAGPFMVDTFDATNNELIVVKNDEYWNADIVALDQIIFKKIAEKTAAIAALADGSIDIFDSQYVAGKTELSDVTGILEDISATPAHQELSFNHLNPYIGTGALTPAGIAGDAAAKIEAGKDVRKAISHIINRDFAANDILGGLGLPAATIIPSTSVGWDETILARIFSITKAKEYMVEAGYDYTDMTLPATADNHFFNMSILSPNTNPARNTWSAAVAEILPEIGIWVNEHLSTTWGEIGPRTWTRDDPAPSYSEGGFDIFFVGYSWDLDVDPTGLFDSASITPNGDNFYNFNQTEYDGLLLDYTTEMDLTDRITAFKILQAYMYEWEIVAAIVYPQEHWAYYDGITGFDPLLMSISTEEWDLMGTDRQAEGSGFLPLDFTPVLIAMLSVAAAIRFKRH